MIKVPQRPRDTNQLAKRIVDMATGENAAPDLVPEVPNPAQEFARRGGLIDGKRPTG